MKEFTIKDGTVLKFNPLEWNYSANYNVKIVAEDDKYYTLQNDNGIKADIPKEIVSINNIPVVNKTIELTESLYNYYIKDPTLDEEEKKFNKLFRDNINLILTNRELIFKRAEYFLLRPGVFHFGHTISGGASYCLGGLLESWMLSDELFFKDFYDDGDVYLLKTGGSPLTGTHFSTLWSFDKGELIFNSSKGNKSLREWGGFGKYVQVLRKISAEYPLKISFQLKALENLLQEIDSN